VNPVAGVALCALALVLGACGGDEASQSETDQAVATAKRAYDEAKAAGVDLEVGPCIDDQLPGLPDWVADVAHDPRTDVDDDPANQCQRYRDGDAHHFVELTPEGELIRAQ
jgi:hypothetical protein